MSQQPPKQGHYGYQGRQQAPQQNVGAWQPAAPTSQQTQQQQQQFSHARGGGYTVPMNPYAYAGGATNYNPYYAQQGGRVGGWNPNYAGGPPMYQPGPGVYYPQQQPQPQSQQQQSNPKPNVTQPRAKKALVITDKDGNPIDLSSVKKSSKTPAPAPAPVLSPAPAPAPVAAPAPVPVSASKLDSIESKKPSSEETSKKEGKEKSADMSEGSSLMALLTKQEKKEVEKPAVISPSTSPMAMAEKTGRKRHVYSKEEMLRLRSLPVCMTRPGDLPEFVITKGPSRNDGGRGNGPRGSRNGGDGGSWQRGMPQKRQSTEKQNDNNTSGGQWGRGQALPVRQQNNNRKGHHNNNSFYDGPVAPLEKSKNGWRPQKDSSPLIVAEKKVKSILNKMTKEKFDRLASQMLEIPVISHDILKIMIHNVYEKAIDEPAFGDMYGDLCVRMSQIQNSSYIQMIESDEEPPTEDGEVEGSGEGQSSNAVYRWSHDVNTADAEVIGPFSTFEECVEVALSDTEQDRTQRGEMELVLVKLQIKDGMFIKVMKKKAKAEGDGVSEGEAEGEGVKEVEEEEFYTVYFPVKEHEACGQQLSKIFLSERECLSDATKQNSFKRSLLNKCEDEFNKQDIYVDWKKEKKDYEENKSSLTDAERVEKEEELDFRRMKIKKQMLGNIKFIGQLYKKALLKEKIMRFCIASLLKLETENDKAKLPVYIDSGDTDMDEEDHEAICNMFSTIGSTIDKSPAADFMKVCFGKITKLSIHKDLPSRSRFMYKDLLDLRANKWVPRRKVEKAKTIDEIRKDFEREEKRQAQKSAQQNFRGGGGRRDNKGGRESRGDNRKQNNSRNSYRTKQQKPGAQMDDDGFTTIVGGGGGGKARSSMTSSYQKPSQTQKRSTGKTQERQTFSALAEDTARVTTEVLDDDKLERRIKSIRSEYIQDPKNMEELMLSMDELQGTPKAYVKFVQMNCDRIIDCKDAEREAIYDMLGTVVDKGKVAGSDVKEGLVDLIEFIDSYVYDAPKAFDYLGEMLVVMYTLKVIDMNWICEQSEKTRISSGENPEKIIRAFAGALEAKAGKESISSALDNQSVKEMLGERWNIVTENSV